MIAPFEVFPSTTSHKHEPLLPTLDIFARLGMRDLDLNLNHIIERGAVPAEVQSALGANGQRVRMVSGGWCDFFDAKPKIQETFASVERQAELAGFFGVDRLRLFFGRMPIDVCTPRSIERAATHIRHIADRHPELLFVFENHDGASSRPEVCHAILDAVARANARFNFDPINFEVAGVECGPAGCLLASAVAHVHLKGLDHQRRFCGFGAGRVDLTPTLRALIDSGYRGAFTVEYEGPGDRTVQLYESWRRAQATIARLIEPLPADGLAAG